jgi:hypothetical protein
MSTFEIVAHRGVPNEYPENTLTSFERAIELGADRVRDRNKRSRARISCDHWVADEPLETSMGYS